MSGVQFDKKSHDAASKALLDLAGILGAHQGGKAITIHQGGRDHVVNKRFIQQQQRLLADIYKRSLTKKGKKGKKSEEEQGAIVDAVQRRVAHAFDNSFAMSAGFRRAALRDVRQMLGAQQGLSARAFDPKPLAYLDDAFVAFFRSIDLNLLRAAFAGESAALRSELDGVNTEIADFLVTDRVCASTVLQAIMSHYVTMHGLRVRHGDGKTPVIRLDGPLSALLDAPMSSSFNNKSLARWYQAAEKTVVKKDKNGDAKDPKLELGPYRQANPGRSVRDFVLDRVADYAKTASAKNREAARADKAQTEALLREGYMPGQTMLVLINAHLIGRASMIESGTYSADDVKGTVDSDMKGDVEQNPFINRLLAIQTLVKLTTSSDMPRDAAPTAAAARSPARSAAASPARSRRAGSASPARSASGASPRRATRR